MKYKRLIKYKKVIPFQSELLWKSNAVAFCKVKRYTHKIAISNHRILQINSEDKTVTFSVKDYKHGGRKSILTLSNQEFIRRFALHILPKGFTRIRHYGILSSN